MTVFVVGATGFVGRALVARLLGAGLRVRVWARSVGAARAALGADVEIVGASADEARLVAALEGCGAVINLAGESILGRWSATRKKKLVESRVQLTEGLVRAIGRLERRPSVMISASAIGYYGDRGDESLDEQSGPGADFLAGLCRAWEGAAMGAVAHGVRVVTLRIGVVLGKEGGALASMLPAFTSGLGARLGTGRQVVSWIHLRDLVELVMTALGDEAYDGPINAVAPRPVTNLELTRALASALGRPAPFAIPGFALGLALGEGAAALLGGQRVSPTRASALGFRFRHETIQSALDDALDDAGVHFGQSAGAEGVPGFHEVLRQETRVDAPIDEVFGLFSKPANLGLMTPPMLGFQLLRGDGSAIEEGALLDYRISLGPLPMRWRTRIERWQPPRAFVDQQLRGPYALWWHEHRLEPEGEDGERTVMTDTVRYRVPFGPVGRIANAWLVRPMLRRIFAYRAGVTALRFSSRPPRPMSRAA